MICLSEEQIQISQKYSFTKFNSFLTDLSISYPPEISESLWFSAVSRRYKDGNIGQKWAILPSKPFTNSRLEVQPVDVCWVWIVQYLKITSFHFSAVNSEK